MPSIADADRAETRRQQSVQTLPTLPDDEPVWRYVHLPKLVDLIARRKLPLVRVDLLGDRFEGSIPRAQAEDWLVEALGHVRPLLLEPDARRREERLDHAAQLRRSLIRYTHASCWRAGRKESAAMWRAYCGSHEGAAVRTTFGHLKRAVADEWTMVTPIHYLDFDSERLPNHNLAYPLLCKRIEFAHEREVRVLRFRIDAWRAALGQSPPEQIAADAVEYLDFDPEEAIEEVYVSPYAPDWYFEAVRVLLEKLAPPLAERLRRSHLADDPEWA
jgi:hypothetical protein